MAHLIHSQLIHVNLTKQQCVKVSLIPPASFHGCDSLSVYNNTLGWHTITNLEGITILVDNEQIAKLLTRQDPNISFSQGPPHFAEINKIIAEESSKLTAARRFGGQGAQSFNELATDIKPYPRI